MDSLQSLDNRLREEHDNIKEYAAQISQQDEGGYVEEERPRQQRGKKKPDPSPRRAMPRYYERTQSREEFDNDENDMYMDGEDNYTFRRSPSLRSLRQQPTYMSGTEGSMSRSHYASADNLSRRPMRRKPEVRDGDWSPVHTFCQSKCNTNFDVTGMFSQWMFHWSWAHVKCRCKFCT